MSDSLAKQNLSGNVATATGKFGPLVGAVDEGTSSARFLIFSATTKQVVAKHQIEIKSTYPQEGWVEQDPLAVLRAVNVCIDTAVEKLRQQGGEASDIIAIGVTNQRETTIVWDSITGEPLYNAIVWLDVRTTVTVEEMLKNIPDKNPNYLKSLCGLPLSPYFSALKIRWLMENVPTVRAAVEEKRCCFGTMDTWLIWNLTGGSNGGIHMTDVTNASRTMLMNLETLKWDPILCRFFKIPMNLLPKIYSSSEIYAKVAEGVLQGVPISGCLGDQQSALLGQLCFKRGQAKSTYGTGCFLLYNTGSTRVESNHGLVTTVAYQMGRDSPAVYALEGSVAVAGAALGWLRDNIKLLQDVSQSQELANEVNSSGDLYFVPAFAGLYAPYWQPDARGVICGLSEDTKHSHIIRAALEAVCFQIRDILEAMNNDCGLELTKLQVDGGMTANNLLMQLQADLVGISVMRPKMVETTALGAAMVAGSAEGIEVWKLEDMPAIPCDIFHPSITEEDRNARYAKWKMAVERSFGWESADVRCDDR